MMRSRSGMGENIAVWWPGETSKVWQGLPTGRPIRPRIEDVDYLRRKLPGSRGSRRRDPRAAIPLSAERKSRTSESSVANAEYGEIRHHFAREGGRFFNERDEPEKRRVVFFGNDLAVELFGDVDPVGQDPGPGRLAVSGDRCARQEDADGQLRRNGRDHAQSRCPPSQRFLANERSGDGRSQGRPTGADA